MFILKIRLKWGNVNEWSNDTGGAIAGSDRG